MSQCCACLSPQEERIINKKVNREGRERVYKILDRIRFTVPHVDVERAKFFTESMMTTEGELLTLRWAKALKNVAEKITVYITPDQLPEDWSEEQKKEFFAEAERRVKRSKWMLTLIFPLCITFCFEIIYLYIIDPWMNR